MTPRELYETYRGFSALEYDKLPETARRGWERVAVRVAKEVFDRAVLEALAKR